MAKGRKTEKKLKERIKAHEASMPKVTGKVKEMLNPPGSRNWKKG